MSTQTKIIYSYIFGSTRNILLGSGLCYAIEKKEYSHIPIIILFPSIYVGYNLYDNKEKVLKWVRNIKNY
jgi:hypothetical protein